MKSKGPPLNKADKSKDHKPIDANPVDESVHEAARELSTLLATMPTFSMPRFLSSCKMDEVQISERHKLQERRRAERRSAVLLPILRDIKCEESDEELEQDRQINHQQASDEEIPNKSTEYLEEFIKQEPIDSKDEHSLPLLTQVEKVKIAENDNTEESGQNDMQEKIQTLETEAIAAISNIIIESLSHLLDAMFDSLAASNTKKRAVEKKQLDDEPSEGSEFIEVDIGEKTKTRQSSEGIPFEKSLDLQEDAHTTNAEHFAKVESVTQVSSSIQTQNENNEHPNNAICEENTGSSENIKKQPDAIYLDDEDDEVILQNQADVNVYGQTPVKISSVPVCLLNSAHNVVPIKSGSQSSCSFPSRDEFQVSMTLQSSTQLSDNQPRSQQWEKSSEQEKQTRLFEILQQYTAHQSSSVASFTNNSEISQTQTILHNADATSQSINSNQFRESVAVQTNEHVGNMVPSQQNQLLHTQVAYNEQFQQQVRCTMPINPPNMQQKLYQCKFCSKTFQTERGCNKHMKTYCKKRTLISDTTCSCYNCEQMQNKQLQASFIPPENQQQQQQQRYYYQNIPQIQQEHMHGMTVNAPAMNSHNQRHLTNGPFMTQQQALNYREIANRNLPFYHNAALSSQQPLIQQFQPSEIQQPMSSNRIVSNGMISNNFQHSSQTSVRHLSGSTGMPSASSSTGSGSYDSFPSTPSSSFSPSSPLSTGLLTGFDARGGAIPLQSHPQQLLLSPPRQQQFAYPLTHFSSPPLANPERRSSMTLSHSDYVSNEALAAQQQMISPPIIQPAMAHVLFGQNRTERSVSEVRNIQLNQNRVVNNQLQEGEKEACRNRTSRFDAGAISTQEQQFVAPSAPSVSSIPEVRKIINKNGPENYLQHSTVLNEIPLASSSISMVETSTSTEEILRNSLPQQRALPPSADPLPEQQNQQTKTISSSPILPPNRAIKIEDPELELIGEVNQRDQRVAYHQSKTRPNNESDSQEVQKVIDLNPAIIVEQQSISVKSEADDEELNQPPTPSTANDSEFDSSTAVDDQKMNLDHTIEEGEIRSETSYINAEERNQLDLECPSSNRNFEHSDEAQQFNPIMIDVETVSSPTSFDNGKNKHQEPALVYQWENEEEELDYEETQVSALEHDLPADEGRNKTFDQAFIECSSFFNGNDEQIHELHKNIKNADSSAKLYNESSSQEFPTQTSNGDEAMESDGCISPTFLTTLIEIDATFATDTDLMANSVADISSRVFSPRNSIEGTEELLTLMNFEHSEISINVPLVAHPSMEITSITKREANVFRCELTISTILRPKSEKTPPFEPSKLTCNQQPGSLASDTILTATCSSSLPSSTNPPLSPFQLPYQSIFPILVGNTVRIKEGPMKDFVGIVCRLSEFGHYATVELQSIQKMITIEIGKLQVISCNNTNENPSFPQSASIQIEQNYLTEVSRIGDSRKRLRSPKCEQKNESRSDQKELADYPQSPLTNNKISKRGDQDFSSTLHHVIYSPNNEQNSYVDINLPSGKITTVSSIETVQPNLITKSASSDSVLRAVSVYSDHHSTSLHQRRSRSTRADSDGMSKTKPARSPKSTKPNEHGRLPHRRGESKSSKSSTPHHNRSTRSITNKSNRSSLFGSTNKETKYLDRVGTSSNTSNVSKDRAKDAETYGTMKESTDKEHHSTSFTDRHAKHGSAETKKRRKLNDETCVQDEMSEKSVKEMKNTHIHPSSSERQQSKKAEEPQLFRTIYVSSLSSRLTDFDLRDFYSQWGDVKIAHVLKKRSTGESRHIGYVIYANSKSVDQAMKNRPHRIHGKEVRPRREMPKNATNHSEEKYFDTNRMFVKGIHRSHTKEMFSEYFAKFGRVEKVEFIVPHLTKVRRDFCFVEFTDFDSVDKCVQQQRHKINGFVCITDKAQSREDRLRIEGRKIVKTSNPGTRHHPPETFHPPLSSFPEPSANDYWQRDIGDGEAPFSRYNQQQLEPETYFPHSHFSATKVPMPSTSRNLDHWLYNRVPDDESVLTRYENEPKALCRNTFENGSREEDFLYNNDRDFMEEHQARPFKQPRTYDEPDFGFGGNLEPNDFTPRDGFWHQDSEQWAQQRNCPQWGTKITNRDEKRLPPRIWRRNNTTRSKNVI